MSGLPNIVPFGDSAFLVTLGDKLDFALNRRVLALAGAARRLGQAEPGWGSPVPAYASLLVPFNPDVLTLDAARLRLEEVIAADLAQSHPESDEDEGLIEIPVCYGGSYGPDIDEVAEFNGLTREEVVALHSGTEYRVFMLGFAPGFAYLGILPPELATPRRPEPRPRVPAGSVGIGGAQTAVYPLATPGGLRLIGLTQSRLWDSQRDPPALLRPGMRVRFVPEGEVGGA